MKVMTSVRGCADSHHPHLQSWEATRPNAHNSLVTDGNWLESGRWIPTPVLFAAPIIDSAHEHLSPFASILWVPVRGAQAPGPAACKPRKLCADCRASPGCLSKKVFQSRLIRSLSTPSRSPYLPNRSPITLVSGLFPAHRTAPGLFCLSVLFIMFFLWYVHPPSTPEIPITLASIY